MRSVYWIKAADKDFRKFPKAAQERIHDVLAIAAEGQKADTAKPMRTAQFTRYNSVRIFG